MILTGKLSKLTVQQLHLYIDFHGLSRRGKKGDKVERIKCYYYLHKNSIDKATPPKKAVAIASSTEASSSSSDEDETMRIIEDECNL
jgi:hypothetical protein